MRAGGEAGGGAAVVTFEVAAEVREVQVAEPKGDLLGWLAGDEESRGGGHAFALKPFAGGAAEVAVTEAFELAQGEAEVARGGGDIPLGALGEVTPKPFDGRGGGFRASAGHGACWAAAGPWRRSILVRAANGRVAAAGDGGGEGAEDQAVKWMTGVSSIWMTGGKRGGLKVER